MLSLILFFLKKPVPNELLESVAIPGTDTINFHHIKSYTTETPEQHPRLDVTKLPFFTYLDHVNTNFIYVSIIVFFSRCHFCHISNVILIIVCI